MKGNNTMNKKLILTTALVSMLAVSANAELKIAGSIESTYGDNETPATGTTAYQGNAIGQETKFEFVHTKDLVGGWKSTLDMEVMEVAGTVADTEITIAKGATKLYISKDGGSIMDQNVVPGAYNARPGDNISGLSSASMDDGTIHGVQNFGVQQAIDGFGKVELRYAPDMTAANTAGDKSVGSGGGSGMEYGFIGNFGVDGLNVHVAKASTKNATDNGNDETDNTSYGIGYNFGQFAVGYSKNSEDAATAGQDHTQELFGVTFAASDSLTLGVNLSKYDSDTTAAEEETVQLEIAYNLGGATIAFAHQQVEDFGGTAGTDGEGYMITYKQSF